MESIIRLARVVAMRLAKCHVVAHALECEDDLRDLDARLAVARPSGGSTHRDALQLRTFVAAARVELGRLRSDESHTALLCLQRLRSEAGSFLNPPSR